MEVEPWVLFLGICKERSERYLRVELSLLKGDLFGRTAEMEICFHELGSLEVTEKKREVLVVGGT